MCRPKGFTLIEVLVVLIILGLTSALVLPKFPAIYDKFKSRSEQDDFYQVLSGLPLKAYTQGRDLRLDQASASELLNVPAGWELKVAQPILYKANGVCLGGELSYTAKGITSVVRLFPPFCEPVRS